MTKTHPRIGSVSSGTLRDEDLADAFADELRRLHKRVPSREHFDDLHDFVLECETLLNELAPDYTYFGTHPGDGAEFGFWVIEDFHDRMKEDGVLWINDLAEMKKGHTGPVCVVNDHGNATYYIASRGKLREVWSIV
jgi:hypothetical protein